MCLWYFTSFLHSIKKEISIQTSVNCPKGEYNCPILYCGIEGECLGTFVGEATMESEQQCQVRKRNIDLHNNLHDPLLFSRTFALPHLGVAFTPFIVIQIGAYSLKIVMTRIHARAV